MWTIAKNDNDWQLQVFERCGGQCAWAGCNSTWGLWGHHVFSRRYEATRLVVENGVGLCGKHHSFIEQLFLEEKKTASILLIGSKTYRMLEDYLKGNRDGNGY